MAQPITPCNDSHFKRRLETAFFELPAIIAFVDLVRPWNILIVQEKVNN